MPAASPSPDELRMLIAVISLLAPENKSFPSPNHAQLAERLGMENRVLCKNRWSILTRKIKSGDYGDFGDLIVEKEARQGEKDPNHALARKRAVVDVPVDEAMNEPGSSPTKKAKGGARAGKGRGKRAVNKEEGKEGEEEEGEEE